jgi:H+/Cl- antiporter ClcA
MIVLCSVCFNGSDPVMTGSLNAGILVLLGITAVVLGCFGYFFVRLAQRSREAAHLVGADPMFERPFTLRPPAGPSR